MKTSEQLISLDVQNASTNYKSTYSVEIIPICKDDLVCLPKKLAMYLSNISQLCLCTRVGNSIHLTDPTTLGSAELSASQYWRQAFNPLAAIQNTIEFIVLDIEPTQHPPVTSNRGKFLLADAQITPASGGNDEVFHTRTHLGAVLKPGDTVIGYYLSTTNFNDPNWESLDPNRIPEVMLVRKTFPARRKKGSKGAKKRKWKLKSIAKEVTDDNNLGLGREKTEKEKKNGRGNFEQARAEADYEMFLRDLEEDAELRANVQLWKAEKKKHGDGDDDGMETESVAETEATDMSDDDEDFPKIRDDELLIEGMTNMKMMDIAEGAEGDEEAAEAAESADNEKE